ncbi:MAG: DUF503 domain-containing protein [Candidatus Geothermincolia bacterium]
MGKMFVGVLRLELFLPECGSLKAKRSIVKSVVERTRARYRAAVVEYGHLELWQRASVGIAVVGVAETPLRELLARISSFVEGVDGAQVIETEIAVFAPFV